MQAGAGRWEWFIKLHHPSIFHWSFDGAGYSTVSCTRAAQVHYLWYVLSTWSVCTKYVPVCTEYVPDIVIKLIKVQPTCGLKEWKHFFGRLNKLNPAWLQKVDVQQCITRAIFGMSLFITQPLEYILNTYKYVPICTQYVLQIS